MTIDRGAERTAAAWIVAALAWLGGLCLQLQQPALLPPPWAMGAVAAALVLLVVLVLQARGAWPATALLLLALATAVLGWASTDLRAAGRLGAGLAPEFEGQDLVLVGTVASLPQRSATGTRFEFAVESAMHRGQAVVVGAQVPARVRLAWYAGIDADGLLDGANEPLRAGQRWRLVVRLRQPHGSLNPHGFDHELWLFEQNLRATGYVRALSAQACQKLADDAAAPVERLRQRVRDAIDRQVGDSTTAGVLAALAIGDQGAIERDDWELFRATGIAHLVSISGLHVTMFAWAAGAAVGWLWRRSSRLMLALPAPSAARWGGLLCAAGYAVLAGWGVPAQRTVWMLAVVVLLRASGLRWPAFMVLLAAALLVCMLDPWAMLQVGFWLSFCAVALLMASEGRPAAASQPGGRWVRLRLHAAAALRTQAVATVGLTPLTMVFFQQVSVVGFGANLLAIPLVTLLITPLALLGVLLPPLWIVAAWLVQGLMAVLAWMAQAPWATWSAAVAPPWAAAAGLLGGVLLVAPLPWRMRLAGVPLMLPLLWPAVERPAEGRFELVAVDVGQGTAVLVRTRSHLLVYDAGPRFSPESDAGQRMVLPLLRARGEPQVDLLMLSHRDSDHVGGAATLLRHAGVKRMSSSLEPGHPLLAKAEAQGVPQDACADGQSWTWDGVRFELLHPLAGAAEPGVKPNFLSCVLRIIEPAPVPDAGPAARTALLTGDIEAGQETALVQRAAASGKTLKSDLLLVPHHGSRTSSTGHFLDTVAPSVAVVQAGYRSRFGHPAPDVVQRYLGRGIKVVRSDRCGAWSWKADGTQECHRVVAARYWHHRTGPDPAGPTACSADSNLSGSSTCPSTLR